MDLSARGDLTEFSLEPPHNVAQAVLDALPTAAVAMDGCGRITGANAEAELFLGWSALTLNLRSIHEVLDCRADDSIDHDDACPVIRVLQGIPTERQGRMWLRCRDSHMRPVRFRCTPLRSQSSLAIILAFEDLTRQLDLESDLRRLATIAEESPIAIVELNEDANMIHANPAMMKLVQQFGFSSEARPAILPRQLCKLVRECLSMEHEMGPLEAQVQDTYYEWKLTPVGRAKLVRAYGLDVSERKHGAIQLAAAKEKAEAANRAKSEFLANSSHEIRSPIHVILGMADLLAQSSLTDEQQHYLRSIQSNAERLSVLTADILDMAALERRIVTLDVSPMDPRAFIEEAVAPWQQHADEKGIGLKLSIGQNLPGHAECDYGHLRQVLNKLLSNAVKFTERGEISVAVDRSPLLPANGDGGERDYASKESFSLLMTIADTGIGIRPENQERIFERFAQGDGSSGRTYEGIGLGLALAKRLVEMMGGGIGVESEPGRGSKFWVIVPMRKIDLAAVQAPPANAGF